MAPQGQNERILFVDDEVHVVRPLREILVRLGYQVTCHTNSVEAWELFSTRPHDFDLVVTDQSMPDMTGIELSRRILELRRDIPVMLTTGDDDRVTAEHALALGVREVVLKPVSIHNLACSLRAALDRSPLPETT